MKRQLVDLGKKLEDRQKRGEIDHLALVKKGTEGLEELFNRQDKEREGVGLFN